MPSAGDRFVLGEVVVLCASGSSIRANDRSLRFAERLEQLLKAVECSLYLSICQTQSAASAAHD
jgi:hypothetical protein